MLPLFGKAQSIALVDRDFKRPMTLTQTLSIAQLAGRHFPIHTADLDSVIEVTATLARQIADRTAPESEMQVITAGKSKFAITIQKAGNYNTYRVLLSTMSDNLGASLELVNDRDNNYSAVQKLYIFLDYLKNNIHLINR